MDRKDDDYSELIPDLSEAAALIILVVAIASLVVGWLLGGME